MGLVPTASNVNNEQGVLCSVCIANYNGEKFIENCIDSVLKQENIDFLFEIIVHDDASTDGSVDLLNEKYPNIRLLESKENVGFCVGNNRMVSVAKGQFILLLNNDAQLFPDALATLFAYAQSQHPQGVLSLPQYDWQTGELVDRGCLLDPFYNPVPNLDSARLDVAMVIGACLWIPRQLWIELGGFPEWMGSIAEDMYLCCCARVRGYPVQVAPTSGYRHMQGMSFGGNRASGRKLVSSYRRRILSERNKSCILFIFTPNLIFLCVLLMVHFFLLAIEGSILSLIFGEKKIVKEIYFNSIGYLITNYNKLLDCRKSMQFNKSCSLIDYYKEFTFIPRKFTLLVNYGLPKVK